MSYPPLPSNGETQWGDKFRAWADAIEGRKVEGNGLSLQYDSKLGERVFLVHPGGSVMIHGDTGWRRINGSLINGWTTFNFRIRRINHIIELQGRLNGTEKTSDAFMELPSGFRFSGGSFTKPQAVTGGHLILRSGGTLESSTTVAYADVHELWMTNDAWPTILPGTPY